MLSSDLGSVLLGSDLQQQFKLQVASGLLEGDAKLHRPLLNSLGLQEALTHPALRHSLLSVDQLSASGWEVAFKRQRCVLTSPEGEYFLARRTGRLYEVAVEFTTEKKLGGCFGDGVACVEAAERSGGAFVSKALQHQRCGHFWLKGVNCECDACNFAKGSKAPHKKVRGADDFKGLRFNHLVAWDHQGPFEVKNLPGGGRLALLAVDDQTSWSEVFIHKTRDENHRVLADWCDWNKKPENVRIDNAREFRGRGSNGGGAGEGGIAVDAVPVAGGATDKKKPKEKKKNSAVIGDKIDKSKKKKKPATRKRKREASPPTTAPGDKNSDNRNIDISSYRPAKRGTIRQCDIGNAFINASLQKPDGTWWEEVFMKLPPHWGGDYVKLHRSLYGLKSAPKHWYMCLARSLVTDLGYKHSESDPGLFEKIIDGERILVGCYVDDLVVCGSSANTQIARAEILRRWSGKEIEPTESTFPVREFAGACNYLATCRRPDIACAVQKVSRCLVSPTDEVTTACRRLLRYLRGTVSDGVVYTKERERNFYSKHREAMGVTVEEHPLVAFCDSNYGDLDPAAKGKATGGHVVYWRGCPVWWASTLQDCVSLSSAEAETGVATHSYGAEQRAAVLGCNKLRDELELAAGSELDGPIGPLTEIKCARQCAPPQPRHRWCGSCALSWREVAFWKKF
eukprot:gene411-344_t